MKNRLLLLFTVALLGLAACEGTPAKVEEEESLVEIKDRIYTEYYPGRKAIKYRGPQDENELRHGRWMYFNEKGDEMSMTEYSHGKKNGASFARYPNGAMHYYGSYTNDVPSGEWITYDEKGNVAETKDFGEPK